MDNELRLIWDAAPIGIAKVDRKGRFLSVNPRYCEMLGYSETELVDRTFQQITHPDDLAPDVKEAENLASTSSLRSYQMVKRYISKDGRTVWVNLLVCSMRDAANDFTNFIAFAIELTPISAHASDPIRPTRGVSDVFSYAKNNPKEAAMIAGIIFMLAQGKNLVEIVMWLTGRANPPS
jgi:PAS domain S-box-containing protein